MPIASPPGSVTTAIVPSSITAMAGTITALPRAAAASTVAAASSVARYTDQRSGPAVPSLRIPPATCTPSFEKLK